MRDLWNAALCCGRRTERQRCSLVGARDSNYGEIMNARILVVDDSGFARRTLKQMLEGAGHTVDEAKDGPEALERYFLDKPDLVMLDMVMEGMNGLEVLAKLRELDPEAKVIIATADVQTSTRT